MNAHQPLDEADLVRERLIATLQAQVARLERQRSVLLGVLVAVLAALAIGGGPDAARWLVTALGAL